METETELLKENLEVAKENNKMLRQIRGAMRWGRFFKTLYWLVIIGSAVGAYYFLQPFIASLEESLGSLKSGVQNVQNIGKEIPDLSPFLENLKTR